MAERKPAKKGTQKSAVSAIVKRKAVKGFTDEEKGAMRERVKELQSEKDKVEGERAVLAKIATMAAPDRAMAKRLHAIVKASAPALTPKLWYGMPAYAKNGTIVCFFQDAKKFKTRYATFGLSDAANVDEGGMWPVAYALTKLTAAEEAKIGALVKRAVS
jgi:uncharacterized protein YdhG (YjbR/CyaY superfamily)